MSIKIQVSDEVYSRLGKLAIGFDTPSDVIERLLDERQGKDTEADNLKSKQSQPVPVPVPGKRRFTNREIQQRISSVAKYLPIDELEQLCDKQVSKELFKLTYPLFKRLPSKVDQSTKQSAVYKSGCCRWTWKFSFERDEYTYAVCTQWFAHNDKYVAEWLASHPVRPNY